MPERTASRACGIRAVWSAIFQLPVHRLQRAAEMFADRRAQPGARRMDGVGVDVAADLARDIGFARHGQRERHIRGLERSVVEDRGERVEQSAILPGRPAGPQCRHVVDEHAQRQRL